MEKHQYVRAEDFIPNFSDDTIIHEHYTVWLHSHRNSTSLGMTPEGKIFVNRVETNDDKTIADAIRKIAEPMT